MKTDICQTCDQPHPHPNGFIPKHPFNDGSLSASATFGVARKDGPKGSSKPPSGDVVATPVESAWPFDPVLRQALIDKGVLTPQDLVDAEAKIRAITSTMLGGNNGQ